MLKMPGWGGLALLLYSVAPAFGQSVLTGVAESFHAPQINGGANINGSVQVLSPESFILNGGAVLSGDLLVPGKPSVGASGNANFQGVVEGSGAATPTNFNVTISGNATLRKVITRTDGHPLPDVAMSGPAMGTRSVVVNSASTPVGPWATVLNLTLAGNAGSVQMPAGRYGKVTLNSGSTLVLGAPGGNQLYEFDELKLESKSKIDLLGQVTLRVKGSVTVTAQSILGTQAHPEWLGLQTIGAVDVHGRGVLYGFVLSRGTLTLNGQSNLDGGIKCDRLVVKSQANLKLGGSNLPPLVNAGQVADVRLPNQATLGGTATDPDGRPGPLTVTWTKDSGPGDVTFTDPHSATTTATFTEAGHYTLRLTASDTELTASSTVDVTVLPANTPPLVQLTSPENDQEFKTGMSVPLSATATDDYGIDHVTFYVHKAGEQPTPVGDPDTAVPYTGNWIPAEEGEFFLEARATDTDNLTTASAPVRVTVIPANLPPEANDQRIDDVFEDVPKQITLDYSDPDGDGLTFAQTNPDDIESPFVTPLGRLTGTPPNLTYVPNANVSGVDVFTYQVIDQGGLSATATVTIMVQGVNDAPTISIGAPASGTLIDAGDSITLSATATDEDGTVTGIAFYSGDTKIGDAVGGSFSWSPASGTYQIKAVATDNEQGTTASTPVTLYVNAAPVVNAGTDQLIGPDETASLTGAVTDDGLPSGATISLTWSKISGPGTVQFTSPDASSTAATFSAPGAYTLRLVANDSRLSGSDEVVVRVNSGPLIGDNSFTGDEDTAKFFTLKATDPDGDALTFSILTTPAHGSLDQTHLPELIYSPAPNFNGADTFTFKVTDIHGASSTGTASITVNPVNDPPMVDASAEAEIELSEYASLTGTASDDGPMDNLSYLWEKISGPGEVSFLTATSKNTIAMFNAEGDYTLRLTVSDGDLTGSDEVSIKVLRGNQPPVVNAGSDRIINHGDIITLAATATDDGPTQNLRFTWRTVAADGNVTFGTPAGSSTTALFGQIGKYTVRVAVSDGELSSSDTLQVEVIASNAAPVVSAGSPGAVVFPGSFNLQGSVVDDNLPASAILSIAWSKASGPGQVFFTAPSSPAGSVSFSAPGTYVLRLSASDTDLEASADVTITVNAPGNQPPVVRAGPDQTISAGNRAQLNGSVSDDGLPAESSVATQWSKTDGPGEVTFGSAASAVTTAVFSTSGTYTLRLTADDTELSGSDDITVVINSQNQAPVVDAGANLQIRKGDTAQLSGLVTDDGLPSGEPLQISWSMQSGPAQVTINSPNKSLATANFSATGTYVLELKASDSELIGSDTITVEVAEGCKPAPPGLVCFVAANGTSSETISGGNAAVGPEVTYAPGQVGQAFSFQGGSQGYVLVEQPNLDVGIEDGFTVEGWVYPIGTSNWLPIFGWRDSAGFSTQLWNLGGPGTLHARIMDASNGSLQIVETGSHTLQADIFQHVAMTYSRNAGTVTIYRNGAVVAQRNIGSITPKTRGGFWIGHGVLQGFNTFQGKLDEVSLYKRCLTSTEINQIYQLQNEAKCLENTNLAPRISNTKDKTIPFGYVLPLGVEIADDGLPQETVLTSWSSVSGPGTVAFQNAADPSTTASFSAPGTYVLRLTASDTELKSTADVIIKVLPDGTTVPPDTTVSPYQDMWRYRIYPGGTVPSNIGALNFDEAGYQIGTGGFGSGGGCSIQSTTRTNWPTNTDIVLRKKVIVPDHIHAIRILGTVDNDLEVFVNGQSLTAGLILHDGCPQPDDLRINCDVLNVHPGENLVVVRGRDRGGETFLDARVVVDQPVIAHAGVDATVDGGDSVQLDGSASSAFSQMPLTYQWSQLSGPTVILNLTDPVRPEFVAPELTTSTALRFRLIVSDGTLVSNPDDVIITVTPASSPNLAPVVNAGPNQTLQNTYVTTLAGTAQDDGLPTGSQLSTRWSVVSAPGPVQFTDVGTPGTAVQFSVPGVYRLRLTADDTVLSTAAEMTVTITGQANRGPVVNAGPDQAISYPANATLSGTATDDGLPFNTLTTAWNKVSGPGNVGFTAPNSLNTQASFDRVGTYVLKLAASDGALVTSSTVTVTVSLGQNQAPVVNLGPDITVDYGGTAHITPQISDDGLPGNGIEAYLTVVQAAGDVQFNGDLLDLAVTFGKVGTYIFRVTGDDGALTSTDDITVQITPGSLTAPVIQITSPTAGSTLPTGQSVPITADASSGNGAISKVEFFLDGISLGESTAAPFSCNWSNPAAGTHSITAIAVDVTGVTGTAAGVQITVVDPPLGVTLTYPDEGGFFTAGQAIPIVATTTGNAVSLVEFYVDGNKVGQDSTAPYTGAWSNAVTGPHTMFAKVTDTSANSVTSPVTSIQVLGDLAQDIDLISPSSGTVLTQPTAVIGTTEMGGTLREFVCQYRKVNQQCATWVTFAAGNQEITEDILGTFDTTKLQNGLYELRLVATDLAGRSMISPAVSVTVDGGMKIGHFTVAFNDLTINMPGMDLSVGRAYDSRDKCPGDFGVGWNLDLNMVKLEKSHGILKNWAGTVYPPNFQIGVIPTYYIEDFGPHTVTVVFPDGKVERFQPLIEIVDKQSLVGFGDNTPPNAQLGAPPSTEARLRLLFNPAKGTHGKIVAKGIPQYFYYADTFLGGMAFTSDPEDIFGNILPEPSGYTYEAQDGRKFEFDANGKLQGMSDRVGNTLTITPNGVFHSAGKSITWHRDSQGRIDYVTDPKGKQVRYEYDAAGDLRKFFDREADYPNAPTVSMTYKPNHDVDDIFDARGNRAAKNFYDGDKRLYKTVDAEGKEMTFTHDIDGRTETIKDRAGNYTTHRYDERGNVVETINAKNERTAYTYHAWSDGTKSDLKTSESVTGKFTDDSGNLVTKTLTTTYAYEDDDANTPPTNDGFLRKIVDPVGHVTRFTYDTRGHVLTMTDPQTNASGPAPAPTMIHQYFENGLLEFMEDAAGNRSQFTYDANGNPDLETKTVTLTNPDGTTQTQTLVTDYDYNSIGFLQKVTDPAGHAIIYTPDVNGNRVSGTTTRTKNGTTVTMVTEFEYDDNDRLTKTWAADNPKATAIRPSSETVYNELGQAEWTIDALGRSTHHTFTDRGQPRITTFPDNTYVETVYDDEGRPEIRFDRRRKRTQTIYDELGRVSQTVFLDGENGAVTLSSIDFDAAGRVYRSTDARNLTTTFVYDNAGRRTKVIDALGQVTRYSHDQNGNVRFFTDNRNKITEHIYDNLNRRVRTIYPATQVDINGSLITTATETVITYDELGRQIGIYEQSPVSTPQAERKLTRYCYDTLGRLRHVLDSANRVTSYTFDEVGNQLTQTDANQHTTHYSYDNLGRRLTRQLPLGQLENLQFDLAGNLRFRTDFNRKTTEFRYDSMNRLRFKIPDSSLNQSQVEFTYTASGQRETMIDETGTTTYHYDNRSRLARKETPFGNLVYSHNNNNAISSLSSENPNGVQTGYQYDNLNRLEHVVDGNLGTTNYGYDPVGNLEDVFYPNALEHHYQYNDINRLTNLTLRRLGINLSTYRYTVGPAGHRASAEETLPVIQGQLTGISRKVTYRYDNLNRLERETISAWGSGTPGPTGSIAYTLDNVGNRLTRTSSVQHIANQSFTYDANDRVNGHDYDDNGNTLVGETKRQAVEDGASIRATDSYTFEDRLEERTNPDGSKVKQTYDGDGNLVKETTIENGITRTVTYLFDTQNPTGYSQVVEEHLNGMVSKVYNYGHDLISIDQADGSGNFSASFYGYDGHGSVRLLTDEAGQPTDTYTYDGFGELIHKTGTTENPYLYCGERYSSSLNLYYLRARFMSTNFGRFWNMDSFEGSRRDPGSLHKYLYCHGDSVNHLDPTGHYSSVEVVIGQIILGTLVGLQLNAGLETVERIAASGITVEETELLQDTLNFLATAKLATDLYNALNFGVLGGMAYKAGAAKLGLNGGNTLNLLTKGINQVGKYVGGEAAWARLHTMCGLLNTRFGGDIIWDFPMTPLKHPNGMQTFGRTYPSIKTVSLYGQADGTTMLEELLHVWQFKRDGWWGNPDFDAKATSDPAWFEWYSASLEDEIDALMGVLGFSRVGA